ncbi:MAG: leucine-rich repeat domain-containing protein [Clostridia bacterium]|nr:leucine-rich repeat domain-containing protein [Clostridia bacterium]
MKKKNSAVATVVATLVIIALAAFVFAQPMLNTTSYTTDSDVAGFLGQAFGKYPVMVNEKDLEKVEVVEIGKSEDYQYITLALNGFIEKRDAYYEAYNNAVQAGTSVPDSPDFSKELCMFQTQGNVDGTLDISLFKNAKEVNITGDVFKLSPTLEELKDMSGLKSLYIEPAADSKITDISVLADKSSLTTISLAGNEISDLSPLANLANLESITLDSNGISDISALGGKENLKSISLIGNAIADISVLSTLNAVETLALDENEISDISVLSGKETITNLSLSSNMITDISPIASMKNIYIVSLAANNITDVSPLAAFSEATDNKFILLSENPGITDWSSLDVLPENVMIIGKPEATETENETAEGESVSVEETEDAAEETEE